MNTRKALGVFTGRDTGDTFLSDPRVVEHFSRAAAARQADIRQRQQDPQVSLPHARLAAEKASEAARLAMLNSTAPLVDKFSAYQTAKKYASQSGADGGLRALAQHLRVQWESDPDGFFSAADLVQVRDHFQRSFGRTAAVELLSDAIPRAGVGDLPIRRLAQMATQIRTQADYESTCRRAGLDGNRPDQVRARAYLRALVRRAAEGDDVMQVAVNEQQGAQLSGIPADDGGGVLSGADLQVTQLHAQAARLPTEKQVTAAVLDANVVRIAGYSLFINDNDRVEIRTPRGASREAPISKLGFVVRDFLKAAQAANFEPSVNEQQEPYVSIDETEGGDVIGKDSTSDESATNAIVPSGKPKAQHPMQSNSGTSASEKNIGADSAGKNPTWGNPALSGAHASDPHSQSGTSFSDRNLGPDHQQDNPSWENPGPIITSREARLDDSPFLAGGDPAERYRRARENRPSARLLEGIADEQGWLARRVLAQLEGDESGKGDEAQTPGTEVLKEAARTTVRLRDDVFQIGDGFVDRTADSKLVYTFGYDAKHGQPRMSELQRYIDTCCGGVRAYRVASVSQVSPGVVRTIVIEAQEAQPSMFGGDGDGDADDGFESKRDAVRRAMGKAAIDHGNDSEGMGSDYEGTILNKEGAGGRWCEKCKVKHREKTKCPYAGKGQEGAPAESAPAEPAAPAEPSAPAEPEYDPYEDESMIEFPNEDVQAEAAFAGQDMLDWNEGQGSAIYAVGSSLMSGHPVPMNLLAEAADRIDTFLGEAESDEDAEKLMSISETLRGLMARQPKKQKEPAAAPAEPASPEPAAPEPAPAPEPPPAAAPSQDFGGAKVKGKGIKFDTQSGGFKGNGYGMASADIEVPGYKGAISISRSTNGATNIKWTGKKPPDGKQQQLAKKLFDAELKKHPNAGVYGFKNASRRIADAPEGWEDTVEEMVEKHTDEIDNPFALANWMEEQGYEPGGSDKEGAVSDVPSVGVPAGPKEGTQKAIKPVKDVPALAPKGQPKQGQLDYYGPGEFNPYDYDPPGLADAPAWCSECGNNRVTNHADAGVCDDCFAKKGARSAARISEGWGEGGEYKRDIEAESAQEVWELHRGLGGATPDFKALQQAAQQQQQQQQQESMQQQQAQVSAPIEPRQDAGGKVRLPEPEPETLNAEQQPAQQTPPGRRAGHMGKAPSRVDGARSAK